jgi:hypothetical protein
MLRSRTRIVSLSFAVLALIIGGYSTFAYAQAQTEAQTRAQTQAQADAGKLAITIAPPLYQITIAPGTAWKSTLRVVNTNHYPLTIHADVSDFHPDGETGNAIFDDLTQGDANDTRRMSGWISLPVRDVTIPPDQSYELPLTIIVPQNADPGGHYGAILVGTLPPHTEGSGASIGTRLSSLIFLRVPGDVVEEGLIRDFVTPSDVVQSQLQTFTLRFENKGNVHLVPHGQIIITNMWGKKRGVIVVNEKSTFGNVLPGSTRKFSFQWKGEDSIFDIGRYKAEASLSYGEVSKQSATRTTYFWIIPFKPVAATLLTLCFVIWFFTWSMRRYIRKALELERSLSGAPQSAGERSGEVKWVEGAKSARDASRSAPLSAVSQASTTVPPSTPERLSMAALRRPLAQGAAELRLGKTTEIKGATESLDQIENKSDFVTWAKDYRLFLYFVLVFIFTLTLVGWYFVDVFQSERSYNVTELRPKG